MCGLSGSALLRPGFRGETPRRVRRVSPCSPLRAKVIQVTHANWSVIGGHRGQVEKDVTVVDVSPTGDWSQVKVWYDPSHNLGNSVYPTYGFIYRAAQRTAGVATQIAEAATGRYAARSTTIAMAAPQALPYRTAPHATAASGGANASTGDLLQSILSRP